MIELIPAIDIINGKCVRLRKGDYEQKTVYGDSPALMAQRFEKLGFKRLHVVDLDGAKSKHVVNIDVLREITSTTSLKVDFGGGIKTDDDIEKAFEAGAEMVTVGSIAVTSPTLFYKWLDKYGAERMILGADVRNGMISINGWKDVEAYGRENGYVEVEFQQGSKWYRLWVPENETSIDWGTDNSGNN